MLINELIERHGSRLVIESEPGKGSRFSSACLSGKKANLGTDMTVLSFTSLVLLGSLGAGFLGSLTGLGGGVVIIPLLTTRSSCRYPLRDRSLARLGIRTSSGAAAAYVAKATRTCASGCSWRSATTLGAIAGAVLAAWV